MEVVACPEAHAAARRPLELDLRRQGPPKEKALVEGGDEPDRLDLRLRREAASDSSKLALLHELLQHGQNRWEDQEAPEGVF